MRKGKTYYEGGRQFRDVLRVVNKYGMGTRRSLQAWEIEMHDT